jgi:hypothetical protein
MATFYTGVDKERYDAGNKFLPMDWALLDYKAPTTNVVEDQVTTSYGIPNTNAFTNDGGGTFYSRDQKISDFNKAIAERQNRLENPGWIQQQINKFTGGQRPVSEMGQVQYNPEFTRSYNDGITSFGLPVEGSGDGAFGEMPMVPQPDERLTGKIPLGIGSMISMALPDKYYSDFTTPEQALTQMYMGYTDPNTNMGNKDPFGINVRSMTGNYAEYADKAVNKTNEALAKSAAKRGLTWDAATGTIIGADEDDPAYQDFMNMTKGIQKRLGYYGNVTTNFNTLKSNYATAKKQRDTWEKETYRELDEADKKKWGPDGTGDHDEGSGAGGTWSGPVGPQPKDKDYADPGVDAAENQPGGNDYGFDDSGGFTGEGWSRGGRVGLRYGGLLSIL